MSILPRLLFNLVIFTLLVGCGRENVGDCLLGGSMESVIVLPDEVQQVRFFASDEPLGDSIMGKFYGVSGSGDQLFEIFVSEDKTVSLNQRPLLHYIPHASTIINFQKYATFDNIKQILTVYEENEIGFEFEFDPSYTPQVLPGRSVLAKDEQYFFLNSSKEITVDNALSAAHYYGTVSPIMSLDVSNGAQIETKGSFPKSHAASDKALSDFYPSFVVNNAGDIAASFAANDSIFVFQKNGKQERFLARSQHSELYPALTFEESTDMAKVKELLREAPLYLQLIYNKHRSEYYRLYRHDWKDPDEKGKISVIVLNQDLEKQCEVLLNADEVHAHNLIPSRKGFMAVDLLETKRLKQVAFRSYEF